MKRLSRVIGVVLAMLALMYFLLYARDALAGQDLRKLLDGRIAAAAAALTALYTLSIFTTIGAWSRLLQAMHHPISCTRLSAIVATTQFGKYLPGNIAQHIGRIALARAAGVPLPTATMSLAYELLLALVASAHVGALTLLWSAPDELRSLPLFEHRVPVLSLITVGALVALVLAPRMAGWIVRLRSPGAAGAHSAGLPLDPLTVAVCYSLYAGSFAVVGAGLWLLADVLIASSVAVPHPVFFIGAFAGSWILGFIVPGAPAGLGIREALLSAWLATALPAADVVLLVVALRMATTLGDALNFVWGSLALLHQRRSWKTL